MSVHHRTDTGHVWVRSMPAEWSITVFRSLFPPTSCPRLSLADFWRFKGKKGISNPNHVWYRIFSFFTKRAIVREDLWWRMALKETERTVNLWIYTNVSVVLDLHFFCQAVLFVKILLSMFVNQSFRAQFPPLFLFSREIFFCSLVTDDHSRTSYHRKSYV